MQKDSPIIARSRSVLVTVLFAALVSACMVNEAQRLSPEKREKQVNARLVAGVEALKVERPERARRHFARALEINPKSAPANNAMALLYKYEGDAEKEEEYYKRALSADSGFSPANNNYGVLLLSQGEHKKAMKYFRRAVEDPQYERRSDAYENLGRTLLYIGELDEAELALNKSLRLNSNSPDALLSMAEVLYRKKNFDLSWRYFQQYHGLMKQKSARALYLGILVAKAVKDVEAEQSFYFALERLYPNSVELRALKAGDFSLYNLSGEQE